VPPTEFLTNQNLQNSAVSAADLPLLQQIILHLRMEDSKIIVLCDGQILTVRSKLAIN
jgi:hypothetical protein